MENIASWVATVATIIAALMTASNLGARITGYGFIVFTDRFDCLGRARYRDRAGQPRCGQMSS